MAKRKNSENMRAFWDEKARENPMYYISSFRDYDDQDPDEFWSWGETLGDRFLRESEIPFTGQEHVLEIGCGLGRMTRYFGSRFARVNGLDVSAEMVTQAREHNQLDNVSYDVGSGASLNVYEDETFDFVFSYIVFQHIPDPEVTLSYLREIGRVLKPRGHTYFQLNTSQPSLRERLNLGRFVKRRSASADSAAGPKGLDNPAWIGSRIPESRVRDTLARAGLSIAAVKDPGTQYTWFCARKP